MISQATSVFQVKCFAFVLLQNGMLPKMSFKPEECSAGNVVYDEG